MEGMCTEVYGLFPSADLTGYGNLIKSSCFQSISLAFALTALNRTVDGTGHQGNGVSWTYTSKGCTGMRAVFFLYFSEWTSIAIPYVSRTPALYVSFQAVIAASRRSVADQQAEAVWQPCVIGLRWRVAKGTDTVSRHDGPSPVAA